MSTPPVAIVSGGTFGIGAGISLALARQGYHVVAFGLDAAQPSSLAVDGTSTLNALFAQEGLTADVLEADVSVAADVDRVVALASSRGRLQALVNNAAIGPNGSVLQTPEDLWRRIIDVNLTGAYLCARAVLPALIAQHGGVIVNIGSGSQWGKPNMAAYAASKGGLHALTMALAYDHFQSGVRVNMVIPGGGGIVTGMSTGRRVGTAPAASKPIGTVAGRSATPDDVAQAVLFLMSDAAATITGTVLDVGCFAHQGGPIPRPA